jgi:hypothetical protein
MGSPQYRGSGPERASPDYELPAQDVSKMPQSAKLPATKARQGEMRGHMRTVLIVGMALAIVAFTIGYFVTQ